MSLAAVLSVSVSLPLHHPRRHGRQCCLVVIGGGARTAPQGLASRRSFCVARWRGSECRVGVALLRVGGGGVLSAVLALRRGLHDAGVSWRDLCRDGVWRQCGSCAVTGRPRVAVVGVVIASLVSSVVAIVLAAVVVVAIVIGGGDSQAALAMVGSCVPCFGGVTTGTAGSGPGLAWWRLLCRDGMASRRNFRAAGWWW
ncbi:hypothetical protein EDB85DRAFT_1887410 [Lactarius pseudohatsudake]|nr:hypothetical protein EDB85DRAFT_1887410 [Lactarius pseudohatsudake]